MAARMSEPVPAVPKGPTINPDTSIPNPHYDTRKHAAPTGFLEFKPRDSVTQARFSALAPQWEGVESSEKAVADGVYALDSAEATSQDKRPVYTPGGASAPVTVSHYCSIQ
jgi:hypothetical protein